MSECKGCGKQFSRCVCVVSRLPDVLTELDAEYDRQVEQLLSLKYRLSRLPMSKLTVDEYSRVKAWLRHHLVRGWDGSDVLRRITAFLESKED